MKKLLHWQKQYALLKHLYTEQKGSWCPMDVEWAKDGIDNTIYIVQARPETIHAAEKNVIYAISIY